jgi:hypothetical protein
MACHCPAGVGGERVGCGLVAGSGATAPAPLPADYGSGFEKLDAGESGDRGNGVELAN